MVTLQKSGDSAVKFVFTDSDHYLYGNGEVVVPVNSLSLVIDESEMVTFKKAATADPFISFRADNSNLGTKEAIEQFYKENMVGSTGGDGSGVTPSEVQEMIDESISGMSEDIQSLELTKADTTAVTAVNNALTAHTTDTGIHVNQVEKDAWNAKLDASAYTPVDLSEYWTSAQTEASIEAATSGKADTSAVTAVENDVLVLQDALAGKANTAALTAHTADTGIHVSQQEKNAWNAKAEPYSAGTGIEISGNIISVTGGGVTVDSTLDSGSTNPVANSAITTAIDGKQDALEYYSESTEEGYADIYVRNDDGEGNVDEYSFNVGTGSVDLAHYNQYDDGQGNSGYTSTQIQLVNPEINLISESEENGETETTNLKIAPTGVTINDEDVITESRLADYQPILSAGTGIDITNNVISTTGGGGATYSAGTNISIDTANTINCTLNLQNGGATRSIKNDTGSAISSDAQKGAAFGVSLEIINVGEVAVGYLNKRLKENNAFGPSGNTEFTVGNGYLSTRHNAFEVRQNGDIYFPDTDNTTYQNFYEKPMVRLQDMYGELGNKLETSAITSSITSASTNAEVAGAKAVYDAIQAGGGGGGSVTVDSSLDPNSSNPVENQAIATPIEEIYNALDGSYNDGTQIVKLKRISQSDYDDLLNIYGVDYDTLYIITPDEEEENEGGE